MMDPINQNNFIPSNFILVNFYNQEVCIVWNNKTIGILKYPLPENFIDGKFVEAPDTIKDIKCLNKKVYVFCSPTGIYKLAHDFTLPRISTSGIGLGESFIHVYTVKNKVLYCGNKHTRVSEPVLNVLGNASDIKIFNLLLDEVHPDLRNTLLRRKHGDSCLIANHNNLYLCYNEDSNIIYNCTATILDILTFLKNDKIFGIILLTELNKIILIYPAKKNELKFDQISLESQPKTLCGSVCKSEENKVWLFYSDGEYSYYLLTKLNCEEPVRTLSVSQKEFLRLHLYKSERVTGLIRSQTDSIVFCQFSIEDLELIENHNIERDIQLRPEMIEDTEEIMDAISEKTVELDKVIKQLENEKDLLKRINMYTIKRKVECIPKIKVYCLSEQKFIIANFQKNLPRRTQVVMSIHQDYGQTFVIKNVTDSETVVELSLPNERINHLSALHIHSIVVKDEKGPWCFIKDFVNDPVQRQDSEHPLERKKLTFLKNKLLMLKKLILDKNIDMTVLSTIKRSIRRELSEV